MEEIKVGHFGRTNKGKIFKFAWVKDESYVFLFDNKPFERYYLRNGETIIKESENIIDLIEVGDYVNGWKVRGKTSEKVVVDYYMYSEQLGEGQWLTFYKDNIESIVTHESFNSIKYEVI